MNGEALDIQQQEEPIEHGSEHPHEEEADAKNEEPEGEHGKDHFEKDNNINEQNIFHSLR